MTPTVTEPLKPSFTIKTLAQRWDLTPDAVRSQLQAGVDLPPSIRIGRNIRFLREDVERWEREQVEKETARRAAAAQQQTATA